MSTEVTVVLIQSLQRSDVRNVFYNLGRGEKGERVIAASGREMRNDNVAYLINPLYSSDKLIPEVSVRTLSILYTCTRTLAHLFSLSLSLSPSLPHQGAMLATTHSTHS